MCTAETPPSAAGGFSLVEVLVSLAVLGMCLPVVMSILGNGLRASARAEQYHQAVRLADSNLTELAAIPEQPDRHEAEGTFGQYEWRATTRIPDWWSPAADSPNPFRPREITVRVVWSELGRARSVSLTTTRLSPRP